jgi:hypothetical protein
MAEISLVQLVQVGEFRAGTFLPLQKFLAFHGFSVPFSGTAIRKDVFFNLQVIGHFCLLLQPLITLCSERGRFEAHCSSELKVDSFA